MLGAEVFKLVDRELYPGEYNIKFNASGFSSGVYFYRLVTDEFMLSKKLTVLK
jgi:hypothetical protein